jgi:hypothetical protein
MKLDSRPRRADEILVQQAGGSHVLLDPESGEYYTLNEVGARIWALADGSRTVEEIAATLAAEYDAPDKAIRTDVLAVLGELERERLVGETTS